MYYLMKVQRNITLDKEEINKVENKIKPYGGKLSTLLNNLLKKFNLGEIENA
jgi:hypothetical protein